MHPPPLQILTPTLDQAEEILAIQRQAYQSEALLYQNEPIPPILETLAELTAAWPDLILLVAMEEGRLLGCIRGRIEGTTGYIGRLAVLPSEQSRGIGTALLAAMEDLLAHQVQRFELFTGDKSTKNLHLYQRRGYLPFRMEWVSERLSLVYLEKWA